MKKYFPEYSKFEVKILYTYSSDEFLRGYEIVKKRFSDFHFVKEKSFKDDMLSLVSKENIYTVFFVDDNVFKEPFTLGDKQFRIFSSTNEIACLSLRLHPNLTYCYTRETQIVCPSVSANNIFNWREKGGYFGYPMSLDGHIFYTKDIYEKLTEHIYHNPNMLENRIASDPINKDLIIMYDESKIFNIPMNKVQNYNNNVHGDFSAEYMNEQFLNGKIISLEEIDGFKNISCHQEIDIVFKDSIE